MVIKSIYKSDGRKVIIVFIAILFCFIGMFWACKQGLKEKELEPLKLSAAIIPTSTWKKIPKNGGEWYYTKDKPFPAQPGDTVLLESEYLYIGLNDVNGLPGKPIVFINPTGKTKVGYKTNGNSMVTQRCSYLVFDGVEVGNETDGKFNEQGWNIQSSHNIEIRNFVVKNSKLGFFTNPATGHYPNIYIHDGVVKNIGDSARKNFDEAFYIGNTAGYPVTQTSFLNLRIENVDLYDIGGDGFQIANGVNIYVKNCRIFRCGQNKINDQWFAFLNGGGTSGTWDNNYVEDCPGTPFQVLGTGDVTFRNNTAVRCATGDKQDGFYIRQSFPTLKVRLLGNKIDKVNRNWITQVTPGLVVEDKGNLFGVTVPPIDPHAGYVPQAQYDAIVEQLRVANLQLKNLEQINIDLAAWKQQTIEFVNRKP